MVHSGPNVDSATTTTSASSVRIVRHRKIPRSAVWSLVAASLVLIFLFLASRKGNEDFPSVFPARSLADIQLEWKCPVGHSFQMAGKTGVRRCIACNRPTTPVTQYSCEDHGRYEVRVEFAESEAGAPQVARVKLPGRSWADAPAGLRCPKCRKKLRLSRRDPLEGGSGR